GGLYRSLITLSWADGWLADVDLKRDSSGALSPVASWIAAPSPEDVQRIAHCVDRIDAAERVYWSCEPAARRAAERDHPMCGDWDAFPWWCEEHATIANHEDAALAESVK